MVAQLLVPCVSVSRFARLNGTRAAAGSTPLTWLSESALTAIAASAASASFLTK